MIEIKNLSYTIGHRHILDSISYQFQEDRTYGIIGPNGAGKSTVLKHIMNIIAPKAGTVFYQQQDINVFSPKEYAKKVSFVFQENARQVDFSVYEMLLMGKYTEMDLWGHLPKEAEREVEEVLEELKITHLKQQPIYTLSGGEAQKVFIGRALLQNTPVLLLDEPTSMLDMHNSIELMQCIERLKEKRHLTVIMVLHDLNLAMQSCDEIILMEKGRITMSGSSEEVLKSQELQAAYGYKLHIINEKGTQYIVPKLSK